LLAVADGVGGWNDVGVDPALFSKELCRNVWEEYQRMREKPKYDLNLKKILVEAV